MRQKVKLGPGKIGQKRKALYDEKLRQKGVDFSKLVVELLERELEVQKKGNGLHSRSPLRR